MDYRTYLEHYGVLGMHWGVRKKEENGKQSSKKFEEAIARNRKILKAAPGAALPDWDAYKNAPPNKKTPKKKELSEKEKARIRSRNLKIALGVGLGVATLAGVALYLKNKPAVDAKIQEMLAKFGKEKVSDISGFDAIRQKYKKKFGLNVQNETDVKVTNWIGAWFDHDGTRLDELTDAQVAAKSAEDILIQAGQTISRVKKSSATELREGAYMCFDQDDVRRYQAFMPALWKQRNNPDLQGKGYTMVTEVLDTIKVASPKKQFDAYVDMIFDKGGRTREQSIAYAKKNYGQFALNLVISEKAVKDMGMFAGAYKDMPRVRQEYFDRIKKMGYDALLDDNDAGRLSRSPIIMLNPSKLSVKSVTPITTQVIKSSLENLMPMAGENEATLSKVFSPNYNNYQAAMVRNGINTFDAVFDTLTKL